ncbi:hypothetical protein [Pelagibaculum spongiae]|uniref:Uncharacterized protein n=1 Tax=Pelagibaculum spongiae TaxID=2080658 RepID=A0A2V1H4R8_9GAMM|nr:hypothetical protein [Pelagibaculum spongiae]PVZ72187.1 hypothetical protein DC094_04000 [Pelagibaculum spongiae]
MKLIFSMFLLSLSLSSFAALDDKGIKDKVRIISKLYGDNYAVLLPKSIKTKKMDRAGVTVISFHMEGFSGGNNSSQFIVFLNSDSQNVMGIHPYYHHRNFYDINSAIYSDKVITINSPSGVISFYRKYSIWLSSAEQIGI